MDSEKGNGVVARGTMCPLGFWSPKKPGWIRFKLVTKLVFWPGNVRVECARFFFVVVVLVSLCGGMWRI